VSNRPSSSQVDPLPGLNPAGVVYGVLAVATVIAAESTRRETLPKLLLASIVTMVLYWLAHAYSHHWGSRFDNAREWSLGEIVVSLRHEMSVLLGAALPIAVLLIGWLVGSSSESTVTAVLWTAVLEVVLLEVVPGIRHRLGLRELAVQTLLGTSLGVGILGVRVLLH